MAIGSINISRRLRLRSRFTTGRVSRAFLGLVQVPGLCTWEVDRAKLAHSRPLHYEPVHGIGRPVGFGCSALRFSIFTAEQNTGAKGGLPCSLLVFLLYPKAFMRRGGMALHLMLLLLVIYLYEMKQKVLTESRFFMSCHHVYLTAVDEVMPQAAELETRPHGAPRNGIPLFGEWVGTTVTSRVTLRS